MTNMPIQPLWLTYFIEILLVLEFQLTKTYFGTFSYKAHSRPQISSNDQLVVKVADFTLITGHLYKLGPDEVLHRCVMPHEKEAIIREAHSGTVGGHFAGKPTAQKILAAGLWWPMLHKDTKDFCSCYDIYQRVGKPSR